MSGFLLKQKQSDVSMSDGEMERVDKALSAAFRSRLLGQSNNKKKKGHLFAHFLNKRSFFCSLCVYIDEAKSIVHFKLR